jgi:flagellar hook-associated protein 2
MSSVNLSSSDLSSLLGAASSSSSSSDGIDLSSLLEAATGSSSEGIDVTAAVNAAVSAARAPEVQWQAQETTIQSQESDLTTINTQTTTLETDLTSLDSSFSSLLPTSSDSSIATATATSNTVTGSYVVNVSKLATTASWYSALSVASSNTGLSAGSFSLQLGSGTATPITVNSGETLGQLANAVNTLNLGVTATVVSDSTGSRLSLISNNSGSASDITITNTSPQLTQAVDGSWNSASVADPASTGLMAGSFSIQVGSGTANPVTITSGETLNQLASAINSETSLGVTANVVSDASGSTSHLQIVNNTGNASAITIANTSPQFTQGAQGKDASLTVNGVPISSASNTVTGAVPGLTINLHGADSGTDVTLSVTPNADAITSAINQFVADYNTVIGSVNDEYTYSASSSTAQPLAGDSTLGLLQNALLGAGSYSASNNGTISTLGSLGITMNNDGTLTVDGPTLDNAIQNNSSAVQQFFEGSSLDGFSSALNTQLQGLTDTTTGAFSVDLSSLQSSYSGLEDDINNFEDNYISSLQTNLTAEYNAAEIALQSLNTTKQEINAELGNNSSSSGN